MANPSKERTASLAFSHLGAGGLGKAHSWGPAARAVSLGLSSGQLAGTAAHLPLPPLPSSFSFLGNYSQVLPSAQISPLAFREKKKNTPEGI